MKTMLLANIMKDCTEWEKEQKHPAIKLSPLDSSGYLSAAEKLPDPIEHLKQIMMQQGLRDIDLQADIGSSGNIRSVLNRHKPLTLEMIRNLHNHFQISAEILIQPYTCR